MVSITVYDGESTIGGNKIYVENNGRGVFLDFGLNFATNGMYFEEFLKARSGRGLHDLLKLDLIPKANIYRDDLVTPDIDMSQYPTIDVSAVLLSHAHIDHCGYIGLLNRDIPTVASSSSIAIIKAMQDGGQDNLGSDIAYTSPKIPDEDLLIKSDRKSAHLGRTFYSTSEPSSELIQFMSRRPGQDGRNAKKFEPGTVCGVQGRDLPFDIDAYEVDHSIYGATAYILHGDRPIAYTGDLRFHGKKAGETREFVEHAKIADILITEGTRAGRAEDIEDIDGNGIVTTEDTVFESCLEVVEGADGLVIADFSPRNIERLESFKKIAERTGRQLVVTAKDAYLLHALECAQSSGILDKVLYYDELIQKSQRKWETEVVAEVCDSIDHATIAANNEQYILCFSLLDMKNLLDIDPQGGTYIYSACEAFSEEMVIDFKRLWNWIEYFGFDVHGFILDNDEPEFQKEFHASGHASREDLEWMIGRIDPDVIIPVHTTGQDWFRDTFEQTVIPEGGKRYEF